MFSVNNQIIFRSLCYVKNPEANISIEMMNQVETERRLNNLQADTVI